MNGHLAIHARLAGAAGLAALVKDRIYPLVMPASPVLPAVTYQQTGASSARGALTDPPLKKGLFQVSCWGRTPLEALQVAAQVRLALDRVRQLEAGGVQIDDCFCEGALEAFDPDTLSCVVHTDFRLHYRDPA